MKALLFSAAALLPAALFAASAIPEPFPASRYEKMLADSPFALATVTVAAPAPKDGWATNLILGPVWRIVRDGVEREYAVVKSRGDISGNFTLEGHEDGPDGIQLVSIEWAEDIAKTKAVVKKGTEFATLEADQSTAPVPPPIQQPRPNGQPGLPLQNNLLGGLRRPASPANTAQPPANQPVIPRPTSVPPAANPAAQAAKGAPAYGNGNANPTERQRIRVINSK